jgi:hypothetical protein
MTEVIQFPSRAESAWRAIETNLPDFVRRGGGGEAMAGWILKDLKPRFDACQSEFNFEVPTECAPAVAEVVNRFHDAVNALFGQMLYLEIELYAAKFASGDLDALSSHT